MLQSAKWIGGNTVVKKQFSLDNIDMNSQLVVTGLGYYVCFLNGQRVGDIELAPSYTEYRKRVEYDVYDVSGLLIEGVNEIVIFLGQHWNTSMTEEELQFKPYYCGEVMAIARLMVNGKSIVTDETWECTAGPVVESSIYDGEFFDERIIAVQKNWKPVTLIDNPTTLVRRLLPPIRTIDRIKPISTYEIENSYYLDFGVNIAGKVEIIGNFVEGQEIVLEHAEVIHEDGTLNKGSLRTAKATDRFIAKGGRSTYRPFFTYHGFRYAKISSSHPINWNELEVVACDIHSDLEEICSFTCSESKIADIAKMMKRTFANNLMSIPTDCHQRDERQGWLADAQLSCESEIYMYDMQAMMHKFLDDIIDTMQEDGRLGAFTAPTCYYGESMMWQACYYLYVYYLVIYYEDLDIVHEHYPYLSKYATYLATKETPQGLSLGGLGDWLSLHDTKEEMIRDATYIDFLDKMRLFAGIVGRKNEADQYENKCSEWKVAFHERYYSTHESTNRNSGYYGACNEIGQFANALAICFDITPDKDRDRVIEKFVYDLTIARGEAQLTTGLIGTKYVFDALEKIGRDDIALALIRRNSYPSWGFMLAHGATTVWERWEYMTDIEMNSHCHTPLAAPYKWLITRLLGVNMPTICDGIPTFVLTPMDNTGIDELGGHLKTRYGTIIIKVLQVQELMRVIFTVPEGCRAILQQQLYGEGKHEVNIRRENEHEISSDL